MIPQLERTSGTKLANSSDGWSGLMKTAETIF